MLVCTQHTLAKDLKSELLFRYPLFLPDTKSKLLFKYPLFLPALRPRLLFKYPLFLVCKNKDNHSDILCFYLTQIWNVVQIYSALTWPKTKTVIQIPSISIWQKSRLLFKYPLFIVDTNRNCCLDILCSNPV